MPIRPKRNPVELAELIRGESGPRLAEKIGPLTLLKVTRGKRGDVTLGVLVDEKGKAKMRCTRRADGTISYTQGGRRRNHELLAAEGSMEKRVREHLRTKMLAELHRRAPADTVAALTGPGRHSVTQATRKWTEQVIAERMNGMTVAGKRGKPKHTALSADRLTLWFNELVRVHLTDDGILREARDAFRQARYARKTEITVNEYNTVAANREILESVRRPAPGA